MTAPTQNETNILLLGETGVGKSTFINAFYNYLRFDTLNEALSENMEVLIPSKFTITDENYEYKTIKIGNNDDSNEEFDNTGMSATQTCREYKFDLGDMIVRLIDSPGIGDTRGIDKDKENFDNILKFISHYEYLNGICILLKPNNARLTVLFRFCIQELLSHLHKSAKDNIVFCFTNCRGTLYRPGDTLPALQEELRKLEQRSGVEIKTKKDTMYCFDNESFRFLAASKGGVRFEEMDETNFTKSWERSVEESVRLLKYICFRNPHQVQDTLTLNEARKIVILLAKPIANIEQLIQININLIKDRQNEINSCTKSIRDLNKRLYVPQKALESKQLGYPRTICTNCNTEVVDNKTNYKSHCHPHCYLNGVSVEVVNNVALLECDAIRDDGICYECGCSYKVHMHITYDVDYITIKVVDKTVEEQIKNKKTFREQKEIALKNCEKLRKQQESEKKKITEINIKFAQFLRQSAIATFNDTYAEYLDHFIREEKIKKSHDPANYNDAIIEGLEETRNEYLTKIEIIKKAIATNDPTNKLITPEDIKSYEEELYSLKINGAALKEMKSLAERGQLIVFKQYQSKISNYKSARKSSSKIFNRIFNGFRSKDDYPNCSDSRFNFDTILEYLPGYWRN